ncbi:hypothetical protein CHUAL_002467 [Chamberlinius hualienensis]
MSHPGHNQDSFFDAAEEVGYDSSHNENLLLNMDPVERAKFEEEWKNDLAKTEDEIQTLKLVLNSKMRHAQDLKQKLGITVWKELRTDVEQGLKNVKESDVYLKTETVLKSASEKTTTAFGTLSASMTKKLGDVKNSPTFKSFEEAVGSAYANVKTKVTGSRSSSMPSFEEAYGSNPYARSAGATPATTPVIPEDKPLS